MATAKLNTLGVQHMSPKSIMLTTLLSSSRIILWSFPSLWTRPAWRVGINGATVASNVSSTLTKGMRLSASVYRQTHILYKSSPMVALDERHEFVEEMKVGYVP